MPKIAVNDISMYYEVHGQGEPIVFVAGFSVDHLLWEETAKRFSDKYQVILLDNRGAGQTDVPQSAYSIEQMAEDVAELCRKLKISRAHFVGNSMGGYIVQQLAHRHPSLFKSVVIANSAMATHSPFHFYVAAQLELLKANAPIEAIIKASCAWVYSYDFLSQPGIFDVLTQFVLSNPYPFTVTGYEGQYAALEAFDSHEWAKEINVPALVIGSEQDLVLNASLAEALAKEIPGATYHCFKKTGHLPHIEQPEEFATLLHGFFEKHN